MGAIEELRGLLKLRVLQLLALACLLAGIGGLSIVARTSVRDPDSWWHLAVGDWIVVHKAVPHVGILSRTASTHPWIAYSWGYEVLLSRAYAWFGLVGFAWFGVMLTVAVSYALFWMAEKLSGSFWLSWILCGVGSMSFLFTLMPRPVFLSMIIFMIELTLILRAQRTTNGRLLYWLPPMFILWANCHIQFIYGLFVFGIFVGINLLQRFLAHLGFAPARLLSPTLSSKLLLGILTSCLLASCIGPYSYHLFEVVLTYSKSRVTYDLIQELQPLSFKYFTDYILVALIASASCFVGWRKHLDLFKFSLLIIASASAFHTARDTWFAGTCAAAILADFPKFTENARRFDRRREMAGLWLAVAALLLIIASSNGFTSRNLDRSISGSYPVNAVNFLRRNPTPGPLYNTLEWGGFLAWYMPQYPVAIDGRNDLYGDEIDLMTFKSAAGYYDSDSFLRESRLVLIPKNTVLATKLRADPKFYSIYDDRITVVFVRR